MLSHAKDVKPKRWAGLNKALCIYGQLYDSAVNLKRCARIYSKKITVQTLLGICEYSTEVVNSEYNLHVLINLNKNKVKDE